jgi:hypothetical protein
MWCLICATLFVLAEPNLFLALPSPPRYPNIVEVYTSSLTKPHKVHTSRDETLY